MIQLLGWLAVGLAGAAGLSVMVLAFRRVQIARLERRRIASESRLRPVALALVHEQAPAEPPVGTGENEVFASLLARYSRLLSGEPRARIAEFFDRSGAVGRQTERLRSRRAWVRATAAHVLGDMASPAAIPALLVALDDEAREVRAAAARSLGVLGATEAVEPLVHAFASRTVPRAVAGHGLLTIGRAALPSLRELEARGEAEVRVAAVELVGLLGEGPDAELLLERLRDTSAEVRAKAARALGRLGANDAAAELRRALDDRVPFVRTAAANALGAIGDAAATEALLRTARSDAFEPAHAAAVALGRVNPDALRIAAGEGGSPHLDEAADLLATTS